METTLRTHRDVIGLWKTAAALAREIGQEPKTVCAWRRQGIPPEHFPVIVEAAQRTSLTVITFDLLYALAPARGKRGRPSKESHGAAA